jgi:hypothetical protein
MANVHTRIRQAVQQAYNNIHPMSLRSAAGEIFGVGGDRNRPELTVDKRVSVLAFEGKNSAPEVILFHYACHPTVLSADNLHYSADFPGAARRYIRERYPHAVCLFVNGAAANISTRFHRLDQSFEEVERLGRRLGERVIELVEQSSEDAPVLKGLCDSLALPLRAFPAEMRPLESSGNARIDTVRNQGAKIEATLQQALRGRASQQADVCALQIGSWLLLTVPGEAFNDLAQALQNRYSRALVVGYANDYLGYFPTQSAIDDATYEALSSAFDARSHLLLQQRLADLIQRVQSIG